MRFLSEWSKVNFTFAVFLVALMFVGCNESSTTADGDDDSVEASESSEALDGDSDFLACDFTDPVCDGEDLLTCVEGSEIRTTCEGQTYCNYDECKESTITFPADAGFHAERSEWWYYTGHLKNGDNRWGFEITIFQYELEALFGLPGKGYMCHVAVTDKQAGEHYHFDSLSMHTGDTWTNDPVILELDNCRFELDGDGNDHVVGTIPADREKDGKASPWELDLTFTPEKRVTLHGGDGIIPMSDAGGKSWYYSYTRLATSGTLLTPTGSFDVEGQGWMDHQWGEFDIVEFKGWDWWSMQFEDGYEVMLFQFTDWDGNLATQSGTIIDPKGNITELEGIEDFTITSLRTWESPHTDGIYPLDWDITIPKMDWQLKVITKIDDQEMHNHAQNYWEGDTSITGTRKGEAVTGVGYTELTGYATDLLDPKPQD